MYTLADIEEVVRNITEEKRKRQQEWIHEGHVVPLHYDLRDFTDQNIIYGIQINHVRTYDHVKDPEDLENFNLGSLLTYNVNIPFYRFAKLKGLVDEYFKLYDECEMGKMHIKHLSLEDAIGPIFNILTDGDKFYHKIVGNKKGCQVCIFIYTGWEYRDDLKLLARKFRERDANIGQELSNYYNQKLVNACDRIIASNKN